MERIVDKIEIWIIRRIKKKNNDKRIGIEK